MKKLYAIIVGIVGMLLVLGAFKLFEIPNDYITYDRIVEKVERNKQNLYFVFKNDYKDEKKKIPVDYSFTQYEGVSADYVEENIKPGDSVKVTVINNVGKFKYTLLQKVEKDGVVIFDSIEYYQQHNMNLRLIFIPSIIVISLFIIIIIFVELGKNNTATAFIIRQPKWILSFFIFSTLVGSIIPIMFTLVLLNGKLAFQTYQYSYLFYLFLVLGILGIVSFFMTRIKYDSNNYYFYYLFKKVKKLGKKEIKKVLFDKTRKKKNKSGFYGENDQKLLSFTIEFKFFFSNELFINSLIRNGAKFVVLELDENGAEKETQVLL